MHGQPNVKICTAKQAKQIFQYKKIKIKLYKNNAAIWYNKTCRIKQLTPNYINIRVNGNNTRSQKTKHTAIRYRINQELKFLYIKKNNSTSSPALAVAQDRHLQRVTIPEAAYVQFASTS